MPRMMLACGSIMFGLAVVFGAPSRPSLPPDFSRLKQESIQQWSGAEVLLLGKFADVTPGPVGLSEPPLRTFRMKITADKILRGPTKLAQPIAANFTIRQSNVPVFPEKDALIALKSVRGSWIVQAYEAATPDVIEQAKLAVSFPLGWTIKDGKLTSPWANVAQPKKADTDGLACSVTGRPVLLAGDVRLEAVPVPPKKKFEFKNPDGDGEYTLTVKNDTDQELEVPALLTDGKTVHWNESIVIRIQGKNHPIPGSTGRVADLKPVVLKPGESVSGVVQALALNGPSWPRGGSRVEFQFCLGERSVTQSFYYFSNHHDPIRAAVLKKVGGGE